jgi:hypothetical protein
MFDFSLLIPIVFFLSIVAIIKIVMDARVRRRLTETHASEDLVRGLLEADEQNRRLSALKWGLVLVLMGLAFGLIDALGLKPDDPATYGLLMGAAGIGLLGYHLIGQRRL